MRDEGNDKYLSDVEISNFVRNLMQLDIGEIIELGPLPYKYWTQKLEEKVLTKALMQKSSKALVSDCTRVSLKLRHTLGFHLTQTLLGKVAKVNDLKQFERSVLLIPNHLPKPSKLPYNSWGECENEIEFTKLVEKHILVYFLTRKVRLSKMDLQRLQRHLGGLYEKIRFETLLNVLNVQPQFDSPQSESLLQMFGLVVDYGGNAELGMKMLDVLTLRQADWKDWCLLLNKSILETQFRPGSSLKTPKEVVRDWAKALGKEDDLKFQSEMVLMVEEIQSGKFRSTLTDIPADISTWDSKQVNNWAKIIKRHFQKGKQSTDTKFCREALTVCKRAFYLHTNFHLTSVQIVSIFNGINKGLNGALMQIATGSGKSTIEAYGNLNQRF